MRPFVLNAQETLFLMIDMQEKLLPAIEGRDKTIRTSRLLLRSAVPLQVSCMVSEHYVKGLGPTASDLIDVFPPDVLRREKIHFCCCHEPDMLQTIEQTGRRQIVLWGIEAHICVMSTALELLAAGYDVAIAADGIASRQEEHRLLALDALRHAGALVAPAESLIYQLLRRAGTETFKQLLPLFKE